MSDTFITCFAVLMALLLIAYYSAVVVVCVTYGYVFGTIVSSLILLALACLFIKLVIKATGI